MKRMMLSFGLFMTLMFVTQIGFSTESAGGDDDFGPCTAGGPGASTCTITVGVGPGQISYSVTCNAGYYACCKIGGAKCKTEPPIPQE